MTTLVTEDVVDDWENISSDDEIEDLVKEEENEEEEVIDTKKTERLALEKAIRALNANIFANNDKLEDLKKSSKELLLNRKDMV